MTKGTGPGGKHDAMRVYSPDEAALVMKLVEAHLPRWTYIAKLVSEATNQSRTAASVRNYYKRFCASKAIAEKEGEIRKLNRCQMCGQIKRGHVCRPTALQYATPKVNDSSAADTAGLRTAMAVVPRAVEAPSPVTAPAEGLLALSGTDAPIPPLAPAALEMCYTPGTSPLSTTFSLGPFSPLLFMAGSPALAAAAGGGAPFAWSRVPSARAHVVSALADAVLSDGSETTDADESVDTSELPVAEVSHEAVLPTSPRDPLGWSAAERPLMKAVAQALA